MKKCGRQEEDLTFNVYGQEMTFSRRELTGILESYFSKESKELKYQNKVAQRPVEGLWFEVKPLEINQGLFINKLEDETQEETRNLINQAFVEMKRDPERYQRNFKTMMPQKTWISKKESELEVLACELGDHIANWVEQSLEWAQRICNGESWEAICNNPDTARNYRVVVWKNEKIRLVGGSTIDDYELPASFVYYDVLPSHLGFFNAVPLVVGYEK